MMRGKIDFSSIDQYAASHSGVWDLDYQQMSRVRGEGFCRYLSDGSAMLYEERYPADVALRGSLAGESISILLSNRIGQSGRWQGARHPAHSIAYTTSGKEADVLLPELTENLVAVVPLARFRRKLEVLSGRSVEAVLPADYSFRSLGPEARLELEKAWRMILRTSAPTGSLTTCIVESLVSAMDVPGGEVSGDSRRHLVLFRRAMERCEDGELIVSPGELALELGVSLRSLEMAFRSCLDMTPICYLRQLRLNRAHARLSAMTQEEGSVTEVVVDLGITQFGRFSGEYRRLFDELPSETLRKPRKRSASLLSLAK